MQNAHRQPGGRSVAQSRPVEVSLTVLGDLIVQVLLLARALFEGVFNRLAGTRREDGGTIEPDHLFLHSSQEVAALLGLAQALEGLGRGEQLGLQQPPQQVEGIIPPHMGGCGHQQQVSLLASDHLSHVISVSAVDGQVSVAPGGEFVGLVEDDQIVGRGSQIRGPHAVTPERVHTDDRQVVVGIIERVMIFGGLGAGENAEAQAKEVAQFPLPVAHQPGWRNDQHPAHQPAQQHLANQQAGHDGLASAGVVGEQKA